MYGSSKKRDRARLTEWGSLARKLEGRQKRRTQQKHELQEELAALDCPPTRAAALDGGGSEDETPEVSEGGCDRL